ncbi:MAG: right-handed parallel beta-helix repeat-containing protein, partial [Candidatus Eiseniibacteriota bacterium]
MRPWLLVGCALLASVVSATAATYSVHPDGSGDFPTIQAAIDAVSSGDVVELGYGTFTGPGNRDVDFLGKAITVRSIGGSANTCIIDCQASETDQHRGFLFQSGEGPDSRLVGVTVTGGYRYSENPVYDGVGGGILVVEGSSPTLVRVVLASNTAMAGAGLFIMQDAHPTLTRCRFEDNDAWWGSGGGASCYDTHARFEGCEFHGNSSNQGGGGLACSGGEPMVIDCAFTDNTIDYYGGGFEAYFECDAQLEGCTFAGNQAGAAGGAVMAWVNSSLTLSHCTLASNRAPAGSGLALDSDATVDVLNTIIAFGELGEAVQCSAGSSATLNCTDVFANDGGDWIGCIAGQQSVTGNLTADPLFCGTSSPEEPYALQEDSPCAPSQYPCGQVGAWQVGCMTTAIASGNAPVASGWLRVAPNPVGAGAVIAW